MKKIILSIFVSFLMSSTAFAVDLPVNANLPAVFGENVAGNVIYKKPVTVFTGNDYNDILTAYNLRLQQGSFCSLPLNYAENINNTVVYGHRSMGYTPIEFNRVLEAYNLSLSPYDVCPNDLTRLNYAHVENNQVVLHKNVMLYSPSELAMVLAAYKLPKEPLKGNVVMDNDDTDNDGVVNIQDACPDTPAGFKVNKLGCWEIDNKVYFAVDSAKINPSDMPDLFDTGLGIIKTPTLNIQIDGYADSTGSKEYNQKLSERRAMAVKSYLVEKAGVDASRLTIKGYGESQPVMSNETKVDRSQNRRVEFTTM